MSCAITVRAVRDSLLTGVGGMASITFGTPRINKFTVISEVIKAEAFRTLLNNRFGGWFTNLMFIKLE